MTTKEINQMNKLIDTCEYPELLRELLLKYRGTYQNIREFIGYD